MNPSGNDALRSRFDAGAANWDANEVRRLMSAAVARAFEAEIRARCPSPPDLLDYGCRPGRSILPAAKACRSVTGCDFSAPMLEKFRENAAAECLTAIDTIQCDLSRDPLPARRFGALTCSMTLHHVEDIPGILGRYAEILDKGGLIAIADLEPEEGVFHASAEGVAHPGFDPAWMAARLEEAGFGKVAIRRAIHTVTRPASTGEMRDFPLFLVSALKA